MTKRDMKRIAKTLRAAVVFLRRGWTTGAFARKRDADTVEGNAFGDVRPTTSPDANCWCALGAIGAALGLDPRGNLPRGAYREVVVAVEPKDNSLARWNDEQVDAKPVIARFLRVARKLEKQAAA